MVMFGDTRIDPYYWLNQRDSAKVLAYLNAENQYTNAMMRHTDSLQQRLFREMKSRIKETDESVPILVNGYYYYYRFEEGKEYQLNCRRKGSMDAPEEIILDENELAAKHSFCSIAGLDISPNNKILAFGLDTVSRRKYTIYFKNLETGELYNSRIDNTTGTVAWANDNQTVFYSVKDDALRPYKIYRHSMRDCNSSNDKLIFHETDETFDVHVYTTKSESYIMIYCLSTVSTEYWFLDANHPTGKFQVVQPRKRGLEYNVDHYGNKFYIRTNLDAENFRLMETRVDRPTMENWKEIIPSRGDVLLMGIDIFKDFLVVTERKDALIRVKVIKWADMGEYYIDFGEEVYTAVPSLNPEFDTPEFMYHYTSLTTPQTTFTYNMETREKRQLKQSEINGFDPTKYETRRLWATGADGVRIPLSIVYRKGIKLDGRNPTLLYAYGSYGYSENPTFNPNYLSLLDRGFVYAIAHVRGGEEMGRPWYENGKLLNKKNTFNDFIACSEYLIGQKFTSPQYLFAEGGSAGGLLMGAVANMRPDLYRGIIAEVPFVDVVTTMLDTSIPLTTGEFDEGGNPADSAYYFYMKSYSPYDQVRAQAYPNMLVTTGYHDSQVQYFEPAKWVAKLRDMKTDDNLLLFRIDMESGHGGASGRFKSLRETAFTYAFMLDLVGIQK